MSGNPNWPSVPDFEILGELGEGGMGIVYKARRHSDDAVVAVKSIRPRWLEDPKAVRRFQREINALTQLEHPNIVRAHAVVCAGNRHFLIMEFIDGVNLGRLVRDQGPLPIAQACDCIRQAACGLQHIYERGLVHRDVKPSNLLATPALGIKLPPGARVMLLDLGLARLNPLAGSHPGLATLEPALAGGQQPSTLTPDGLVIGTLDYIAPEQARKPREADIRSDLYSLGCTFYFLLTGKPPFQATSDMEKLYKHWFEEPQPVERWRSEVPAKVSAVVGRLLDKRPGERFQTPEELATALGPFCQLDGSLGSAGTSVDGLAETWNLGSLSSSDVVGEVRRFEGHGDRVLSVAVTPNGRQAVSGGWDRSLRWWDVASGVEVRQVVAHSVGVNSVAIARDGLTVLSGGGDATVRLWDMNTGRELKKCDGHSEPVTSVAFAPSGQLALSAGMDGTIRTWDLSTGKEQGRLLGHVRSVNCVAVSPDGRLAISGGGTLHHRDPTVRLWDVESGRELGRFEGHGDTVACVAFSPDGRQALSGGWDQTVRLWDVATGQELGRFEGHRNMVWCVVFSPDGRRALSGGRDHALRLWDLTSGDDLRIFERHTGWVTSVVFSPDGRWALSSSADGTLRQWQLPES